MCLCEAEILPLQLYLYTRRVYSGIAYDERVLRGVLSEAGLTTIRQLLDLEPAVRQALADRVIARLSVQAA